MDKRLLHLHVGVGNLGVGLVLERHDAAASDLVMVNRASSSPLASHAAQTRSAWIQIADAIPERRSFDDFVPFDTPDGVAQLSRLLVADRPVVVTTAARVGQRDVVSLLQMILPLREATSSEPLVIVPCENSVAEEWNHLRAPSLHLVTDVLVDRICKRDETDPTSPLVVTEPYFEWRAATDDPQVASMLRAIGIEVDRDIRFERYRKLCLVNGLQYSFALLASAFEFTSTLEFAGTPEGAIALRSLAHEYAIAVSLEFRNYPIRDLHRHGEMCADRIRSLDDAPFRILDGEATTDAEWIDTMERLKPRLLRPLTDYCRISGKSAERTTMGKALSTLDLYIFKKIASLQEPDGPVTPTEAP